jgi:hypothetical protein
LVLGAGHRGADTRWDIERQPGTADVRPLDDITKRCATCVVAQARNRLSGRARPTSPSRLARLVRHTALALAIGGVIAVPLAEIEDPPPADARSLVPMPALQVPAREPGYHLATTTGDVLPFGAAGTDRALVGQPNRTVGVARTPSGDGTWTVAADGGVFTAGDAAFHGSLGGQRLNRPVVGIAATVTGGGYWLVAADGGVFAFGDARYHGGVSGTPLAAPVVAIAPTKGGGGYWLAAADGGVFAFGDAQYHGGLSGTSLRSPIVAIASTPTGDGYWLAGGDGGVFTFGDAPYLGGPAVDDLGAPVVGIASSRSGEGYWLAAGDGGVFTYGDAPFLGSSPGRSWAKVVGISAGTGRLPIVTPADLPVGIGNRYGHDISWPQCDGPYPAGGYGHAIVGVTGGRPFTRNRCLASQWQWATAGGSGAAVYMNLASPVIGGPAEMHGPAGDCAITDVPCQTYNQSANNVGAALAYARESGVDAPMWWLDVEVLNRWSPAQDLNALTVRAAAETLQKAGIRVGVYSTPYQWRKITGGDRNGLPVWVAGAPTDAAAPGWCNDPAKDFTGGRVWLVQSLPIVYDVNYACEPAMAEAATAFRFRG